jgi:hypothetical protein
MTGQLPVLQTSTRFHTPVPGAATGPTPFEFMSGNLRVLSPQFHVGEATGQILDPDWVQLPLPPGERSGVSGPSSSPEASPTGAGSFERSHDARSDVAFWWHRRYRSRRSHRPRPGDNGRDGAFEGETSAAPPDWLGAYDPETGYIFYVEALTGVGQWRRPDEEIDGRPPRVSEYVKRWRFDATGSKSHSAVYINDETGMEVEGSIPPDDFDGDAQELVPHMEEPAEPPPAPTGHALEAVVRMRVIRRVYSNRSGVLHKAGGGKRFLIGSKAYKPRYVTLRGGRLSYFLDEASAKKLEKRKDREIHLDNYVVLVDARNPKRFSLEPILARTEAAALGEEGAADADRAFDFEAASAAERDEWVMDMGGSPDQVAGSTPEERFNVEYMIAKKNSKKKK